MTALVVSVHGLGADGRDFWGSTPEAVESHKGLPPDTTVEFWGYKTLARLTPSGRWTTFDWNEVSDGV